MARSKNLGVWGGAPSEVQLPPGQGVKGEAPKPQNLLFGRKSQKIIYHVFILTPRSQSEFRDIEISHQRNTVTASAIGGKEFRRCELAV